jgi:hypothetical protein
VVSVFEDLQEPVYLTVGAMPHSGATSDGGNVNASDTTMTASATSRAICMSA